MQASPRSQQSLKEVSVDIEAFLNRVSGASVSVDSAAVSGGQMPRSRSGENVKEERETDGNDEAVKKAFSF
jgi:hypothetical protein